MVGKKTRVLLITNEKLAEIKAAVARAEANPIPWERLREAALGEEVKHLSLADRKSGFERPPSDNVLIPDGYRAAFSVEEQPAGFMHHLSVSVDIPGALPSVESVIAIGKAYGIKRWNRIWLEEFDPGHQAVNILELYKPRAKYAG
jgi:hypothetical protein